MKTIFIGNYKGGVGKTTSVLLLGKHLESKGKKVLLMDLDPQSSLSEICVRKCGRSLTDLNPNQTLNYVFDLSIENIRKGYNLDIEFNLTHLINEYEPNLDYIASSLYYEHDLGLDEINMNMEKDIRFFSILAKLIDKIKRVKDYDYILIDCPPNSSIITQSAFMLSDYYLIPTIVDSISSQGIMHYIGTISKVYSRYCEKHEDRLLFQHCFGNEPQLLGIFYTLIRGQVDYGDIVQKMQTELQAMDRVQDIYIFENFTNNYVDITRGIAADDPDSIPASKDTYDEIAGELLARIAEL
ncbi:ParA family protein [Enterococcus sp. LJL128]|uniref:ParA family protein n=1 Tax=Enterococcus sp. LJL51 TaxID=3416656 RepID=UPI003CF8D23E